MSHGSICPRYHRAVELIGRRWSGAVISAMLGGRVRYHEIRDSVPDISDRMLAERLRELEAEGVVVRHVFPTAPVRIEYELTPKGRALEATISAISRWAEEWIDSSPPVAESAAEPVAETATETVPD
ncbi:MAG: helix-turn-helix transcriptional regulator [Gemmatimonadota bacterium]|nr:helix-turn-helix transcriptional regulator [Gemmatimonadota bacterium]